MLLRRACVIFKISVHRWQDPTPPPGLVLKITVTDFAVEDYLGARCPESVS